MKNEIKNWWNHNPFTYSRGEGVDLIPSQLQDREFFETVHQKFRLHHPSLQENNNPLYSNFINYDLHSNKKILDIACGT